MRSRLSFLLLFIFFTDLAPAQPKKPPKKDKPRLLVASQLGVPLGKTVRLTVRGLHLKGVNEIQCQPKGTTKFHKNGDVGVPNQQEVNKVGNTFVEFELTVPAETAGDLVTLVAKGKDGDSTPLKIMLDRLPVVLEKEPNDGFKQAQEIAIGKVVEGKIDRPQDVDTFRFTGKSGQKVVIEITAARLGSGLDSLLTLYNSKGQILESNDDMKESTDSRIEISLPADDTYYLSVQDAHDQGGPAHIYRLVVNKGK
jgi:hypothetical protein